MMLAKESIEKVFKQANYRNIYETKLYVIPFLHSSKTTNDYQELLLEANRVSRGKRPGFEDTL